MTMFSLESNQEFDTASLLRFKNTDVLSGKREKLKRKAHILKAMIFNSSFKAEVILTVEDQTSLKKLRGRIVAVADDHVVMERGFTMPIRCIHRVEFQ